MEAVRKRFVGGPVVLDGVNLTVAAGEVTVLTGSNGSGKSTLLQIVAGLLRPTSGRVSGVPSRVGYLPERFPGGVRLSASAYLRHMAAIRGESAGRARTVLARLDFSDEIDVPISVLSKGNAQKVALAQALGSESAALVLDEPWSGLDPSAAQTMSTLLSERAQAGSAVLVTDHSGHSTEVAPVRPLRVHEGKVGNSELEPTKFVDVMLWCSPDLDDDLSTVDGVIGSRRDGELLYLRAEPEHSDALLAEALGRGASVWAVQTLEGWT
ncbi:ABC-type multidrug transport system ATPase subunit [Herbihabitans rhizosphaerae]|uniref:ABC-type multidrug transport system ATPase subunit n=1 Tax=Herbihabitans rhizosphaerae TaxID=1872711 RepID=A0A4Q7L244_9PSEU|nr:ABC transporter ATP-binding protein [Herbihabitans rhizosphaerae]RZS43255.1 ABC-type multidrug transport system ATPase subunit [Herbihabitans rhizosphaerae]